MRLVIEDIRLETPRIRSLTLRRVGGDGPATFQPGSHLTFVLGEGRRRSYSLIDWSETGKALDTFTVAVQMEPGGLGGSRLMHELAVGEILEVGEPRDQFPLETEDEPALLIAGGIGVTPLISMASALRRKGTTFRFVYAGRSRAEMAFVGRLEASFGSTLQIHCDDEQGGPLDIEAELERHPEWPVYVCGPSSDPDHRRRAHQGAARSDLRLPSG